MYAHKHGLAVGDIALDDCYMFEPVVLLTERDEAEVSVGCGHVYLDTLFHKLFGSKAIGD